MQRFLKAITAIMLTVAVVCATGCTKAEDPDNGGNGGNSINGHEYVDLGLPSGTLWATCNLGAYGPEGYGDYFAWGETEPKTAFIWGNYKYCNDDLNLLNKYCNDPNHGSHGFTDNLTVLQPGDDAATVNWGYFWRIPTEEQWRELKANTTNIWTTQNGVNGRLFTASNGNSLFLPAAGLGPANMVYSHSGSYGYYWSSSLYTDYPSRAWHLSFNSSICDMSHYNRHYGHSVRAVHSARQDQPLFYSHLGETDRGEHH